MSASTIEMLYVCISITAYTPHFQQINTYLFKNENAGQPKNTNIPRPTNRIGLYAIFRVCSILVKMLEAIRILLAAKNFYLFFGRQFVAIKNRKTQFTWMNVLEKFFTSLWRSGDQFLVLEIYSCSREMCGKLKNDRFMHLNMHRVSFSTLIQIQKKTLFTQSFGDSTYPRLN